jgi:hypothetical protein
VLQLSHQTLRPGIWPSDSVVQWFSSLGVPNYGRFTLVGDTHGFDISYFVALVNED